jgi:hypothetical protein
MDGYWNESAMTRKTLQRGWVQTGDLGRYDEDGYLWFVGRKKDVIVVGGNKVAPLEVEAALTEHPAVRQACVIGVPDATWGEVPHAYVILETDGAASPKDLRTFVADRLAQFMVPADVHVISEMPSKGPGKVDRDLLRMRAITAALIEQVPFFKSASSEFLRDIIPRLDARMFAPGDVVVHEGDVGDEMYFLTRGKSRCCGASRLSSSRSCSQDRSSASWRSSQTFPVPPRSGRSPTWRSTRCGETACSNSPEPMPTLIGIFRPPPGSMRAGGRLGATDRGGRHRERMPIPAALQVTLETRRDRRGPAKHR